MDVPIEPLTDNNAIALPPVHFDRIFGVDGGQIVEGRDQHVLTALGLQKLGHQRVCPHGLSAGIKQREFQRWQCFVAAVRDALHALADRRTGSVRAASSKLRRTSAPVKPRPSSVTPGVSSRFAKAIRNRRPSALAGRMQQASNPPRNNRRRSPGRPAMRYWIASIFTKVPVRPTAFGTVIERKNVARFELAAASAISCVRTFSMMWMPLSVISVLCTGKAMSLSSPGITSTAQLSLPTTTTF